MAGFRPARPQGLYGFSPLRHSLALSAALRISSFEFRLFGDKMALLRVLKTNEVPAGMIRELQIDGKVIALANVQGKFYAIDNVCLHRGGPLAQGDLMDACVTCPWHGWQYDVTTGKSLMNPSVGVRTFPVEVRGEDIYVDVE